MLLTHSNILLLNRENGLKKERKKKREGDVGIDGPISSTILVELMSQ
jgi:hypothetical protein